MYICNNAENAKERSLDSHEEALIIEALYLLKQDKEKAFKAVSEAYADHAPGLVPFEARDFGIPQITDLINYIEGPDEDSTKEGA